VDQIPLFSGVGRYLFLQSLGEPVRRLCPIATRDCADYCAFSFLICRSYDKGFAVVVRNWNPGTQPIRYCQLSICDVMGCRAGPSGSSEV